MKKLIITDDLRKNVDFWEAGTKFKSNEMNPPIKELSKYINASIVNDYEPKFQLPLKDNLEILKGKGKVEYERTGIASFKNKDNILEYVDENIPRFENEGYLTEIGSENLALWSKYLTYKDIRDTDVKIFEKDTVEQWRLEFDETIIAPDGSLGANKFIEANIPNDGTFFIPISNTEHQAGDDFSLSFFAKENTNNEKRYLWILLRFNDDGLEDASDDEYYQICFDLALGEVIFESVIDTTGLTYATNQNKFSTYIEKFDNGWYRVGVSGVMEVTNTLNSQIRFNKHPDTVNNYDGDGVSGGYLWGLQVEKRDVITSYIPTEFNSASRGQDFLTIKDKLVNNKNDITYILDYKLKQKNIKNETHKVFFSKGDLRNEVGIYNNANTIDNEIVRIRQRGKSGVNIQDVQASYNNDINSLKATFSYKNNQMSLIINDDDTLYNDLINNDFYENLNSNEDITIGYRGSGVYVFTGIITNFRIFDYIL